jgi:putative 4-hydroxybenzoate polyprenyltransferase
MANAECRIRIQPMTTITNNSPTSHSAFGIRHSAFTKKLSIFAGDIKIQHTVFALPWALLSTFLASRGMPVLGKLFLILLGMLTARTVAMAVNRLLDARLDAINPRTARRAIPSGALSVRFVGGMVALCVVGFLAAASLFQFVYHNPWPLILSVPVLLFISGYPLLKRFSRLCHYYLGAALALAPVCAWVAIRGDIELPPLLMAAAVLLWTAGFDIIYACQDYQVDVQCGLHSVPSKLGIRRGLAVARITHLASVAAMLALGFSTPRLGPLYFVGVGLATALLVVEHFLVRENDLSKVGLAFFTMNGIISIALGALGILSCWGSAKGAEPQQRVSLMPPDSPWNQDISQEPVDPNSGALIASIGINRRLHPDFGTVLDGQPWGIPYVVVPGTQPKVPIDFEIKDESDPGPYPIPPDAPIEGGPKSTGDRHVLVLDRDHRMLYELFAAYPIDGGKSWKAGSGAIFDLNTGKPRPAGWTSADAAGLPILPGLVRYEETVEQKKITHAIRFTVERSRHAYVAPATHFAAASKDPNRPPMGMRVRLKADYDISKFPPTAQVILTALKTYGMILADNGGNWFFDGAPDPRWKDDEIDTLKRVKGSDFEVVKMGQIVTR